MVVPTTLTELCERIARETARMSYPGSMSRGKRPIVRAGTKATLEAYFTTKFPSREVWLSASEVADRFEDWHQTRTEEIAKAIGTHVSKRNNPDAVAAKFLNTFLHQLMKYEPCRALWPRLHLPLDAQVFAALAPMRAPSLCGLRPLFSKSPYSLPYPKHLDIQRALLNFIRELNARPHAEFEIRSRIELNWLWV
jgi:hypothetical protein